MRERTILISTLAGIIRDRTLERRAVELRLKCERRLGEISAGISKSPGTRGPNARRTKAETLRAAGVGHSEANRFERIATRLSDREFGALLARPAMPSTTGLLKAIAAKTAVPSRPKPLAALCRHLRGIEHLLAAPDLPTAMTPEIGALALSVAAALNHLDQQNDGDQLKAPKRIASSR